MQGHSRREVAAGIAEQSLAPSQKQACEGNSITGFMTIFPAWYVEQTIPLNLVKSAELRMGHVWPVKHGIPIRVHVVLQDSDVGAYCHVIGMPLLVFAPVWTPASPRIPIVFLFKLRGATGAPVTAEMVATPTTNV